jgi:hypothetical protein
MGYDVKGKMILTYNKTNQVALALLLASNKDEDISLGQNQTLYPLVNPHGQYLVNFNWVLKEDGGEGEVEGEDTIEVWTIAASWYEYHDKLLDLLAKAGYQIKAHIEGQEHENYWDIQTKDNEIIETQLKLYKVDEIGELVSALSQYTEKIPELTQYRF